MAPKVSYRAEGPVRGLWISVVQAADGKTRIGVTWVTREKGDDPGQGHRWHFGEEYPKKVSSLAHAVSLAAWASRRALAGQWAKLR